MVAFRSGAAERDRSDMVVKVGQQVTTGLQGSVYVLVCVSQYH